MAMALLACGTLSGLYVGVLYVPHLIIRSRPKSQRHHLLQRFACASVASIIAPLLCTFLLPEVSSTSLIFRILGLRSDHLVQATFYPLFLTAMLYLGPLFLLTMEAIKEEDEFLRYISSVGWVEAFTSSVMALVKDVVAWRNYIVAPLYEEIVFRACMIPLLMCGGYSPSASVFISPLFFSIAHMHRFWELVHYESYSRRKAFVIVGAQLGYTVVFGWYAAFLFVRTGHLVAAIVPHMFCNIMGFPNLLRAAQSRVLALVYVIGFTCFLGILGPLSSPSLYNGNAGVICKCWQGNCLNPS